MADRQIDLVESLQRKAALLAGSLGFVALGGGMLYACPTSGGRTIDPGNFTKFALYCGVVFFGAFAVIALVKLLKPGVVVSIGPRGVFDRRL